MEDSLYKVMVKKKEDTEAQEFIGVMRESKGFTVDKIIQHMKEHFSSEQFKHYIFEIHKRMRVVSHVPIWEHYSDIDICTPKEI